MSEKKDISRLKNFPISFFSVVMGFSGLTIALQKAEDMELIAQGVGLMLALITTTIFVALLATYILKFNRYRDAVRAEYQNPVKVNFFPTISISLLLLSIVYLPYSLDLSRWMWYTGVILQLGLMLAIVNGWVWRKTIQVGHMSPAWFIPAVGSMIVPVAGLAHAPIGISWFFFSVGVVFWLVLLSIFFNRIFFHDMLPEKLIPTLFILMAPPAVLTIVLYKLTGQSTIVGTMGYDIALFMFLLLISQPHRFASIRFYLSWWAYSFPLAALTIASSVMYHNEQIMIYKVLFELFLAMTVIVISLLLVRTSHAMYHKRICLED